VLAGPLVGPQGPYGVLVLVAVPGAGFDVGHAVIAQSLLEPFSVALENDRRLRELAAMRAAAEADKDRC